MTFSAAKKTDVRVVGATVYFLPVAARVPLKFGRETLTQVTCCRVQIRVQDQAGKEGIGWGETPLSVPWAWPSELSFAVRDEAMRRFALKVAEVWTQHSAWGHPLELSYDFQQQHLPALLRAFSAGLSGNEMPHLAALICLSAIDIALHDAYGNLHDIDVYRTYCPEFMNRDLASFFTSADGAVVDFSAKFPCDFLKKVASSSLPVWHLVGGLDALTHDEHEDTPIADDGYPNSLEDWIRSDGLKCLKVKLRGNDEAWDYDRLVQVGQIAFPLGVEHLSADFNCTVKDPKYVNGILDSLRSRQSEVFERLLYVEQPFPYDLDANRIDVHSVAERKPLFLDESAHDWQYVQLGQSLGWTGVALKTCKTQSGSLLSCCWAKAHGMHLMVQDLSNPMLAQISHVRLAAHVHTIMGVESNSMQFYPHASQPEAGVHPGLYRRRRGELDLTTIQGSGIGYRADEIDRQLPAPAAAFE